MTQSPDLVSGASAVSAEAPALARRGESITPRAVLLGLALIPLNAWWLSQIEYVRYSDNATTSALFFNCVALLLLLTALNGLVARWAPRRAFSRGELLTVYIMLVVASALGGHDQLQILFTTISWVYHNATPENRWAELIHPWLPRHLVISDETALNGLFRGDASPYAPGVWRAWVGPLAWWALFALVLVWTLLCLMAIFRKQWERERLNYPIAEPPLELTARGGAVYRSSLFWIAFSLAMVIQMVRLVHNLWPAAPTLNIGVYVYSFNGLPLSAAGAIPLSSYPFSYGMAYLLPLQLAFSVWFFFWLARLELIVSAMFGQNQWNRFPFIQQQGVGAYFGLAVFVLWAARAHLAAVWREATRSGGSEFRFATDVPSKGGRESEFAPTADQGPPEPLPAPVAVWGFLGGVAFLIAFSVSAGMSLGAAVAFFGLFLAIVLALARLRAELGLPTIELYQVGADDILQNIAGGAAWSKRDLSVMTLYFWLVRTHRQLPMPLQGDCLRLGQQAGISLRGVAGVILGASVLAILAAFWAHLHSVYQVGFEQAKFTGPAKWAFGDEPWRKLASWVSFPRQPDWGSGGAYVAGLGVTLLLAALRTRFVWWPFHPAGYLVAGSFGLFRMWLPIFITWLIKSVLLRYGGLRAYRRARPLFLGLICGEFTAAFLRTLLDLAFNLHLPPESGVGGL